MASEINLFAQINNAVLDLQAAELQSYDAPLKRLARLLKHPDLESYNKRLTAGLDLEAFLSESHKTQGGMMGSARLVWPDDDCQALGLKLLLIERFAANPQEMAHVGHVFFHTSNKIVAGVHSVTRQIIIPFVRDYKNYVMSQEAVEVKLVKQVSNKIFIVHGHDAEMREAVARFLSSIGLEPIILHEQASGGKTVIEKVESHADVGFAVVLLTPDDEGCPKGGSLQPRVRQNVLLELGFFIGRLRREKVCALMRGDVEIPSDFAGVVWHPYDDRGGWKLSIGRELKLAGYEIDWNKVLH